jgi:hypothetical protein
MIEGNKFPQCVINSAAFIRQKPDNRPQIPSVGFGLNY